MHGLSPNHTPFKTFHAAVEHAANRMVSDEHINSAARQILSPAMPTAEPVKPEADWPAIEPMKPEAEPVNW